MTTAKKRGSIFSAVPQVPVVPEPEEDTNGGTESVTQLIPQSVNNLISERSINLPALQPTPQVEPGTQKTESLYEVISDQGINLLTDSVDHSLSEKPKKVSSDQGIKVLSEKRNTSKTDQGKKARLPQATIYFEPGQLETLDVMAAQYYLETKKRVDRQDIIRYLVRRCQLKDILGKL